MDKRCLVTNKKVDFNDGNEENIALPLLVDENESENDFSFSDDENIESLEGIFLCTLKSDNVNDFSKNLKVTQDSDYMSKIPLFSSKPSKVIFKDFEAKKIYKQKIRLINVYSSPLSCKLIGVQNDDVKNFLDIKFRSPAKHIMPGMNCVLLVRFFPEEDDIDLDSNIIIKTELGLFSIPLEIRRKFCCVTVQPIEIDFGTHVIGCTSLRRFQISNHGTKIATYNVFKSGNASDNNSTVIQTPVNNVSLSNTERTVYDKSGTISSIVSSEKKSTSTEEYDYSNNEFLIETGSQSLRTPSSADFSSVAKVSTIEYEESDLIGLELIGYIIGYKSNPTFKTLQRYKPQIPGRVQVIYAVTTSDFKAKTFFVSVNAEASFPHVKVKENSYNFNICAYNNLYQDNITLVNEGSKKHEISIEVPKELRNHIEMHPKTGIIKPMGEFITQLKLFPRNHLASDAGNYFDESTGVLEFSLSFYISEQPGAVKTSIHAIISSTQLEFNPNFIDFGECYINESIQVDVTMHNVGILTQHFGFIDVANCISIEPNDGFGIILPKEEFKIKIIFKPDIPMKYNSSLICKTFFNRTFIIKWFGVGVYPPIKLSYSHVNFPATHLNNIASTIIYIKNNKKDEKSSIFYEFDIPDYCPVQIFPNVGHIAGGKSQKLNLIFSPKLMEQQIYFEAKTFLLDSADSDFESIAGHSVIEDGNELSNLISDEMTSEAEKSPLDILSPMSAHYRKAIDKLSCDFENRVDLFTIPCYFAENAIDVPKVKQQQFSTMRSFMSI
uniref:MSP domain-containing protein n=1 Tax=Strigamia maritima TaxID=126957 RepID=T1IV91_STRMM